MGDQTGTGLTIAGACPWCSGPPLYGTQVIHTGACPKLRAIEYHPNGTVKRVEFRDEVPHA